MTFIKTKNYLINVNYIEKIYITSQDQFFKKRCYEIVAEAEGGQYTLISMNNLKAIEVVYEELSKYISKDICISINRLVKKFELEKYVI